MTLDRLTVRDEAEVSLASGQIITTPTAELSGGGLDLASGSFLNVPSLALNSSGWLTNDTSVVVTDLSCESSTITNNGSLAWSTASFLPGTSVLVNMGQLDVPDLTVTNLMLYQQGILNIASDSLTIDAAGELFLDVVFTIGSVQINSGGILTYSQGGSGLDLTITGDMTINAGGSIDITGKGYGPASGPGAGESYSIVWVGRSSSGGAGYGGVGGGSAHSASGGLPYGSVTMPVDPGSGGGDSVTAFGGSGGGAIRLMVTGTLTVDGNLIGNGANGQHASIPGANCYSGGGSGGSIYITTGQLSGSGTISSDGGNGRSGLGGGGAGGRVAIYYDTSSYTGTMSAHGGTGYLAGGAGTVLLAGPDTAPVVISASPSGYHFNPFDHVDVVFSHPIDPATFTVGDVSLSGSRVGPIAIAGVSLLQNDVVHQAWRISFVSQIAEGIYTLNVGPDITNLAGVQLDQDQDGLPGESLDDVFQSTWEVDLTAPKINLHWPRTGVTGHADYVDVYFSEPIYQVPWDQLTFATSDVTIARPNGTTFHPSSVQEIRDAPAPNAYRITFSVLNAAGLYTITVGPQITDLAGYLMDQNGNGIGGEVDDVYSGTIDIQSPDLAPRSDVTVTGNVLAGKPITVTYNVDNMGIQTAVGSWVDSIFISADDQWDINDPLFARVTHTGDVSSGSSYTETVTANWLGVLPDQYYVPEFKADFTHYTSGIRREMPAGSLKSLIECPMQT